MKRFLISLCVVVFGSLLLSDCRSDKYIPDTCFESDILPIFITRCSMEGCHGPGKKEHGYNLSTYEGILKGIKPGHALQSDIYYEIRGNHPSMPPAPYEPLSKLEVEKIKSWINLGAPNSTCNTVCDTSSVTYSGAIVPMFNTWCVGCHNSSNNSGGYNLSDYQGVMSAVNNNRLIGAVSHQPGFVAMPPNTKLSDCDIARIKKWVSAGAPNN